MQQDRLGRKVYRGLQALLAYRAVLVTRVSPDLRATRVQPDRGVEPVLMDRWGPLVQWDTPGSLEVKVGPAQWDPAAVLGQLERPEESVIRVQSDRPAAVDLPAAPDGLAVQVAQVDKGHRDLPDRLVRRVSRVGQVLLERVVLVVPWASVGLRDLQVVRAVLEQ